MITLFWVADFPLNLAWIFNAIKLFISFKNEKKVSQAQWPMSITPATQEAAAGRSQVLGRHSQK